MDANIEQKSQNECFWVAIPILDEAGSLERIDRKYFGVNYCHRCEDPKTLGNCKFSYDVAGEVIGYWLCRTCTPIFLMEMQILDLKDRIEAIINHLCGIELLPQVSEIEDRFR